MFEKPGFYSGHSFVILVGHRNRVYRHSFVTGGYVLFEKPGFYSSNCDGDEGAGNSGENGGGAYAPQVDTPILVGVVAHFFSALLIDAWG